MMAEYWGDSTAWTNITMCATATTSDTATIGVQSTSVAKQKKSATDWLDGRVDAMCRMGRKLL